MNGASIPAPNLTNNKTITPPPLSTVHCPPSLDQPSKLFQTPPLANSTCSLPSIHPPQPPIIPRTLPFPPPGQSKPRPPCRNKRKLSVSHSPSPRLFRVVAAHVHMAVPLPPPAPWPNSAAPVVVGALRRPMPLSCCPATSTQRQSSAATQLPSAAWRRPPRSQTVSKTEANASSRLLFE